METSQGHHTKDAIPGRFGDFFRMGLQNTLIECVKA